VNDIYLHKRGLGENGVNTSRGQRIVNGVVILSAAHPEVRALKRQAPAAMLHGNKIWSSSYVLMDYLRQQPLAAGTRVLDLGCGWGIVSCFMAQAFGAEVVGVDADNSVRPFFELHARHNAVIPTFLCRRFERLDAKLLAQFDVIVGADICFWDEAAKPLTRLMDRAIDAGVKQVFIADPGRPPFWQLADHCAQEHFAEVAMHRIESPRVTTKPVLAIHNA